MAPRRWRMDRLEALRQAVLAHVPGSAAVPRWRAIRSAGGGGSRMAAHAAGSGA